MNADRLARKIRRDGTHVFWGLRAYPKLTIPSELLQERPPVFVRPAWMNESFVETLSDGRRIVSSVMASITSHLDGDEYVYRTYEDVEYPSHCVLTGTTFLHDPSDRFGFGERIEFQHPEVYESLGNLMSWKDRGLDVLVQGLQEKLHGVDLASKTSYLDPSRSSPGGAILTFAIKTAYPDRIQRSANSIRSACRWARAQGSKITVRF